MDLMLGLSAVAKALEIVQGYNFGIGSDGKPFDHPFCPQCEQNEGRQYKLTPIGLEAFKCPSCRYSGHGPIPMLPAT